MGLNVTRALTCKFNAQLSAGRVQTPTLALLVEREKEIRNFKAKDYYTVKADLGQFFVTRVDSQGNSAIYNKEEAEKIQKRIARATFTVKEVKVNKKSVPPPLLYDLTELQRDANKLYKFSPKAVSYTHLDSQANFLLVDLGMDSQKVYKELKAKGIIVRSAATFGYRQAIRVSIGLRRENDLFLQALKEVLNK